MENKTLDLSNTNADVVYTAVALPPLSPSNYNLVFPQPSYKSCVTSLAATILAFKMWTPEASEFPKDPLECTDYNVLLKSHEYDNSNNTDRMLECTTDYISFCMDTMIPARTACYFPNDKPWNAGVIKTTPQPEKAGLQG